jgi:hypothetical protein
VRFSNQAKNVMLDALDEAQAAGAKFGSLHSVYSSTGANELTGGTPAYARKAATWAAAASGSKATSASMVFDVGAGATVRWIGFWDASTAGTFLLMTPNNGGTPQQFVVPDITADILECVGHGFVNNDSVVVWAGSGDPLPGGLTEGTVYFVINATTDDLQLSATSGGASVSITSVGAGQLQKIVVETYGAQGTHTVTSTTLALD